MLDSYFFTVNPFPVRAQPKLPVGRKVSEDFVLPEESKIHEREWMGIESLTETAPNAQTYTSHARLAAANAAARKRLFALYQTGESRDSQ